jgi:cytochrome bd-type quinol oxidase subunit 1
VNGGLHLKEKKAKKLLLIVGWLSVVVAFFSGSIILGLVAASIGAVLRMDYEEKRQGRHLLVMGIISGLSGPVLGWVVVRYLDTHF